MEVVGVPSLSPYPVPACPPARVLVHWGWWSQVVVRWFHRGVDDLAEVAIAETVENVLRRGGRDPGPRTRQDGKRDPLLTVDFTYAETSPPIALEITGLYRGQDLAAERPAERLSERLTAVAEKEQLGCWLVAVLTDARMDRLDVEVLPILREMAQYGQPYLRPGRYTTDDLLRAGAAWGRHGAQRFMEAHRRAKELGIIELTRTDDPLNIVAVVPLTEVIEIVGFADPLAHAIEDNKAKLGMARPRETHLAVAVNRFDASRFSHETPVPALPAELDRVWIVHRWDGHLGLPGVWSARSGDVVWTLDDRTGGSMTAEEGG